MATSTSHQRFPLFAEIGEWIKAVDSNQDLDVILSVSPCRSGTTVLLRVFSAVGIESHYQQLKNALRWRMESAEYFWKVPCPTGNRVFLKETLGPYTQAESEFNPLAALLDAGVPSERLRLLVYGRAPQQTWLSWRDCWRARTSLEHLIQAYKTTSFIEGQARNLGIPVTTAVYEALRDNDPALVIERLLASLAVPVDPGVLQKAVSDLPPLTSANSRIVFPHEPDAFDSWPYLGRAKSSRTLSYSPRADEICDPEDCAAMTLAGLDEIYNSWRQRCEQDLRLTVRCA